MYARSIINPFFAARMKPATVRQPAKAAWPLFAKLPRAPRNASPVPELTSLYHNDVPGDYGNRGYPGNCGGNLIRDLLRFYRARRVFDPMTGSGSCRDVCRELKIDCWSNDLRLDFDLCDPRYFVGNDQNGNDFRIPAGSFDFAWLHPPYWRMKLYCNDPRDLSRAPTLEAFLERYRLAIVHAASVLKPGGKLAILMGDYNDRDEGYMPLAYHTKRLAFEAGLRQSGTEIIRFSHGASSSKKVYRSSFIPGLHDVCTVFEKRS